MQFEKPVVTIFITVQESDSKQNRCWFERLQSESFHVSCNLFIYSYIHLFIKLYYLINTIL